MKWLWFAYKNVIRNRRRSLMTIIITAVGTASILISSGFALYTYDSLREMSARESGHVVIAHSKYFNWEEESPMEYGLNNHQTLKEAIEQDQQIRMAIPRLQFSGLISNGEKSVIFTGTGVESEREFDVKGPFLNAFSQRKGGRRKITILVVLSLGKKCFQFLPNHKENPNPDSR